MNLDKKALAGFIKEIEDSRTRQKAETEFQREVFKRARDKNFDVKGNWRPCRWRRYSR